MLQNKNNTITTERAISIAISRLIKISIKSKKVAYNDGRRKMKLINGSGENEEMEKE